MDTQTTAINALCPTIWGQGHNKRQSSLTTPVQCRRRRQKYTALSALTGKASGLQQTERCDEIYAQVCILVCTVAIHHYLLPQQNPERSNILAPAQPDSPGNWPLNDVRVC